MRAVSQAADRPGLLGHDEIVFPPKPNFGYETDHPTRLSTYNPTVLESYFACRMQNAQGPVWTLLRLDAGVLNHRAPLAELSLYEALQLLGRTGKCFEAHVAQLRLEFRAFNDLAQLAV